MLAYSSLFTSAIYFFLLFFFSSFLDSFLPFIPSFIPFIPSSVLLFSVLLQYPPVQLHFVSVHPSIHLSIYPSIYPSACLSVCLLHNVTYTVYTVNTSTEYLISTSYAGGRLFLIFMFYGMFVRTLREEKRSAACEEKAH